MLFLHVIPISHPSLCHSTKLEIVTTFFQVNK